MSELDTLPFVINIWLEQSAEDTNGAIWRGHITHVPSGKRRYLKDLEDITSFVAPYLEEMGIRLNRCWRRAS